MAKRIARYTLFFSQRWHNLSHRLKSKRNKSAHARRLSVANLILRESILMIPENISFTAGNLTSG